MEFYEEQKFNQRWIWIMLISISILVIGLFGYGFIKQVILGRQFGDNPMSNTDLTITFIFIFLLMSGITWFFCISKLITRIDKFSIELKFIPYHLKFKKIQWNEIEHFSVIKYNPLMDYGGWGLHYDKKGRAYNVNGDKGLKLYLKNGKQILIGTQKEDELNEFLKKLKT